MSPANTDDHYAAYCCAQVGTVHLARHRFQTPHLGRGKVRFCILLNLQTYRHYRAML